MGLGIVCSIIVLILLVGLGYYVKRAQDKRLDQLEKKLVDLEELFDEKGEAAN
jgi:septation ring formation regulator EzrA